MPLSDSRTGTSDGTVRQPRERGLVRARVAVDRIPIQEIIIRNVSPQGIGAASRGAPLIMGERATVLFPDGRQVTGEVRWVNGPSFGLKLDHELDPQVLAQTIQHQHETASRSSRWEVKQLHRVASHGPEPDKLRRV